MSLTSIVLVHTVFSASARFLCAQKEAPRLVVALSVCSRGSLCLPRSAGRAGVRDWARPTGSAPCLGCQDCRRSPRPMTVCASAAIGLLRQSTCTPRSCFRQGTSRRLSVL
ncbi:hypothetical protein QBC34DRAFT_393819 [Podospora aff. communis PSN243]|uniref:Secreted protein n=1 Tax=Podospora aff. communis PSN243 TaxID=3040156 RepID=A0AAV9H0T2_9PEZI|nr:hypothetical protein QBC34DRAFT_393819 [Podospora aff. communis PSN243]